MRQLIVPIIASVNLLLLATAMARSSSGESSENTFHSVHSHRPKVSSFQLPHPSLRDKQQRGRQSRRRLDMDDAPLCHAIRSTMFADDALSFDICTCHANNPQEYLLQCDYSKPCGTFCANDDTMGPYDCFDRRDTYIVQVTTEDDQYVTTLYESCGKYATDGTVVCLLETRDAADGTLAHRCLDINGMPCHCHQGTCGDFVFECTPPPRDTEPWEAFVIDECNVAQSYEHLTPGRVEGLLNTAVFSLDECAQAWTQTSSSTTTTTDLPMDPTISTKDTTEPKPCNIFGCPNEAVIREENTSTMAPESTSVPTTKSATVATNPPTIRPTTTAHPTSSPTQIDPVIADDEVTHTPTRPPSKDPTQAPVTLFPTANPTAGLSSSKPSSAPTFIPTVSPTRAWPTVGPTRTSQPTLDLIVLSLEPFGIVFSLDTNHSSWHPPSMVRAVQRVLVTELMYSHHDYSLHRFDQAMHDFRLTCQWADISGDTSNEGNSTTRLGCTGNAVFRVRDNKMGITAAELASAEAAVLLQDPDDLAQLFSDQLDQPVRVVRVDIDKSVQYRKADEAEEADITPSWGATRNGNPFWIFAVASVLLFFTWP